MIHGYKLTVEQANILIGKTFMEGIKYNPIKDINGDYFIFQEEKPYVEILLGITLPGSEYIPSN